MSIEITGPQGYEFQYLVTVYVALSLIKRKGNAVTSLHIERVNREDIELSYLEAGQGRVLEIQVKSEKSNLDIPKLTGWLCHFASHKSDDCILSRIISDPQRTFIIATGSRCSDDTRGHIQNRGEFSEKQVNYDSTVASLFTGELKKQYAGAKQKLGKNRHKFCNDLSISLGTTATIEATMSRVQVWEQLTKDNIIGDVKGILNQFFHVPQAETTPLLLGLLEIVRDGRDQRKNIISQFNQGIDKARGDRPLLSVGYIPRPDELRLIDELDSLDALYLKGHSFCGKTNAGYSISYAYYERGYNFLVTDDIGAARSFLTSNVSEDRICFLDDPFGHFFDESRSHQLYKKTYELQRSLPRGRKLVVTCNSEIERQISDPSMPLQWHDLTVIDPSFSESIWSNLVKSKGIPADVDTAVRLTIKNAPFDKLLQPGQLEYIGRSYANIKTMTEQGILSHAALDARRVAKSMKVYSANKLRVVRALGSLASTIIPVEMTTINYVLSNEIDHPGFLDSERAFMGTFLFGGKDREEDIKFPRYPNSVVGLEDLPNILDELENDGFISAINGSYRFRHPMYQQAAIQLSESLATNALKLYFGDTERALSVLEVENARVVAKQLDDVLKIYPTSSTKIFEIAKKACLSIFPSVQDIAYTFLLRHLKELDQETAEFSLSWVAESEWDDIHFFWYQGRPFFADVQLDAMDRINKRYNEISSDTFDELCTILASEVEGLSPETAWKVARYIRNKSKVDPIQVHEKILDRLLDFEESFIREVAAFHVMYSFSNPPEYLFRRIFSDNHPYVIFQGIKGSFRGWKNYSEETKNKVFAQLQLSLTDEIVCLKAKNFMTQFGAGHTSYAFDWRDHIKEDERPMMWSLWADLIPSFFRTLDVEANINDSRFVATITDSAGILESNKQMAVAKGWLDWLSRYLTTHLYGNENIFYVTDYFIAVIDQVPNREVFFETLINHQSLHFTAFNVRKFIESWELLTKIEQTCLLTRLKSDSTNILKAIALTAQEVPAEMVLALTGTVDTLTAGVQHLLQSLKPPMVKLCLAVSFGEGFTRALPFANEDIWKDLLIHCVKTVSPEFTKLAVKNVLQDYLYSKSYAVRKWGNVKKYIADLLTKKLDWIENFIIDILLDDITTSSASSSEALWTMIKAAVSDKAFERAKAAMKQELVSIEIRHNLNIALSIAGRDYFESELAADVTILRFLQISAGVWEEDNNFISSEELEKMKTSASAMLEGFVTHKQVKLHGTVSRLQDFARKHNLDGNGVAKTLENYRRSLFEDLKNRRSYYSNLVAQELSEFDIKLEPLSNT